ncbi:MAG: phytase [Ilumatobacteraceae bacterium]
MAEPYLHMAPSTSDPASGTMHPMQLGGPTRLVLAGLATAMVVVTLLPGGPVRSVDQPAGDAHAVVETDPVAHSGDAADDPAIWLHPSDPARSAVIGSDNAGALEVYDLSGERIQRIADGPYGNVDVRRSVATGIGPRDLVVAYHDGIRVFTIDASSRQLSNITDTPSGDITVPFVGNGLCLYRSASTESTYAFVNATDGEIAQYELTDVDADGLVEGTLRRSWDVGTEAEGCVADDELGVLYLSEETVGIWKYGAEPDDPTGPAARTAVETTTSSGGRITPDVEGLTIVHQPNGTGYLIASNQAGSDTLSSFLVYERAEPNAFVREFRVVTGSTVDGCGRTDGIDSLAADLGPAFPMGLFVCQDNSNTAPHPGLQNFKLVRLDAVVGLQPPEPPPPTTTTSAVPPSEGERTLTAPATATEPARRLHAP